MNAPMEVAEPVAEDETVTNDGSYEEEELELIESPEVELDDEIAEDLPED